MLDALKSIPRQWLQSNGFKGPKAYFAALAHQMAGQESAANVQWQAALAQVEQRLAEQRDSAYLMRWKGVLQAASGNRAEAEKSLRLAREMGDNSYEWAINEGYDLILLGRLDEALERLERAATQQDNRTPAAVFRLDPRFDPVRQHPRFQALLARAESDPQLSPKAKPDVTGQKSPQQP